MDFHRYVLLANQVDGEQGVVRMYGKCLAKSMLSHSPELTAIKDIKIAAKVANSSGHCSALLNSFALLSFYSPRGHFVVVQERLLSLRRFGREVLGQPIFDDMYVHIGRPMILLRCVEDVLISAIVGNNSKSAAEVLMMFIVE